MFNSLGSLLKTLPKRSKTPEAIVALHVRRAFDEAVAKTCADLPADILKKISASTVKGGTLTVVAPQLVSAELSMRAGGLLKEINRLLGRRVVIRLKFRSN